jgi:hypothetical protein
MGWVTVVAYLAASLLCAYVGLCRYSGGRESEKHRLLWRSLAVFMFLLAVNKQLDIQSLFTDIGRAISRAGGWYESRRSVQKWFVLGFALSGPAVFVGSLWLFRALPGDPVYLVLICGICFLSTFILVRAASFHHFERITDFTVSGVRVNWVFELSGIGMIALAGLSQLRRTIACRDV